MPLWLTLMVDAYLLDDVWFQSVVIYGLLGWFCSHKVCLNWIIFGALEKVVGRVHVALGPRPICIWVIFQSGFFIGREILGQLLASKSGVKLVCLVLLPQLILFLRSFDFIQYAVLHCVNSILVFLLCQFSKFIRSTVYPSFYLDFDLARSLKM